MLQRSNSYRIVFGMGLAILMETAALAAPGQAIPVNESGRTKPWTRLLTSPTLHGLPDTTLTTPILVRVTDPNGDVLRDAGGQPVRVPINFRISAFPAGASGQKLIPGDATSITILTNDAGYASATLHLGDHNGVYRLLIREPYNPYTIDAVRALTPGVTASLAFTRADTTSHTANGTDVSTVTVRALDYQGSPASGAQIRLATRAARDHKEVFPTQEGPGGLYTGQVTSRVADRLSLQAWDELTGVKTQSTSSPIFIAGPPTRMDIYAVDGPGGHQAITDALVFALAIDAFENKVGPPGANVQFTTDFGTILSTNTADNEWTAWVYSATPGVANVTARDLVSGTSFTRPITFPAPPAPPSPQTVVPVPDQVHHVKFWKPKGANVDNLIAGEISGKRIVYQDKSPTLGGPYVYITYTVNEYDFGKADKNGDGLLDEFKNPNDPTREEQNLLRVCVPSVENVIIVPGMSDNSYGETLPGAVVINQGAAAPAGKNPPVPDGKTLAHENTHYWDLNADNHTDKAGQPLPPDNIGAADPGNASLKCTNKDILNADQLEKLKQIFPKRGPANLFDRPGVVPSAWGGTPVHAGSRNNRITLAFTNSTPPTAPFGPFTSLRVDTVLSSPTFVQNLRPTTTTLTPSTLAAGETGAATFAFDVRASAEPGSGGLIELSVSNATGQVFHFPVLLDIGPPPTRSRNWWRY